LPAIFFLPGFSVQLTISWHAILLGEIALPSAISSLPFQQPRMRLALPT
jgi:hypothetical protein